uniref:BK channel n=1 Tax=Magnetococcus massalia (strain MO-1) TaxID=451514 RepID=A0A1S7LM88_MAGMO|nr:putative Potassium channel protein [Candidatus Magnetococcus massalia]
MNRAPLQRGRIKSIFYYLLEDPNSRARNLFNLVMMLVVFASLIEMTLESNPDLTIEERAFFDFLEYLFSAVFLVEYLLRWWVCSDFLFDFQNTYHREQRRSHRRTPILIFLRALKAALTHKLRWMMQPLSIVDLLAILPMFRAFRLLRVLRVLRVLKLFRYSKRLTFFSDIITERAFELTSLFTISAVIFGMVSLAFFVVERGHNPDITTLWESLYWTMITITTVGYGDITPATSAGRVVAVTGTLVGMWVTVLMTSIIVSALADRIFELKEQRMERQVEKLKNHFIVCGLNLTGQAICRTLSAEGRPFCAVDSNEELVNMAINQGWTALKGDVADDPTWQRLGLTRARSVISAIGEEATNIYMILTIREQHPNCFIVVAGHGDASEKRLLKVGADRAISPSYDGGQYMAYTALRPTALHFFDLALQRDFIELEIEELQVEEGSSFAQVTLDDSQVDAIYDVIVMGLVRDGEQIFKPKGDTVIQVGDILVCMGHLDDLERLRQSLQV